MGWISSSLQSKKDKERIEIPVGNIIDTQLISERKGRIIKKENLMMLQGIKSQILIQGRNLAMAVIMIIIDHSRRLALQYTVVTIIIDLYRLRVLQ
jgi:hypothetical protein